MEKRRKKHRSSSKKPSDLPIWGNQSSLLLQSHTREHSALWLVGPRHDIHCLFYSLLSKAAEQQPHRFPDTQLPKKPYYPHMLAQEKYYIVQGVAKVINYIIKHISGK